VSRSPLFGRRRREGSNAQSLVEYAITVPVFLLMLLGMLELGFAFSHHLVMEYATREGARTGAALANGTDDFPCAQVDNMIIAAVERVLEASGSQVNVGAIQSIRIYKSNASGGEAGPVNVWVGGSTGAIGNVPALSFQKAGTQTWNACTRKNDRTGGTDPDSVGVSFNYTYSYITPLGALMGATGNSTIGMSDKSVMALNPDSD
jgi:Flp pilus assembly protein TadG